MGGNGNRRGHDAKIQMIWGGERRREGDAKGKSRADEVLEKLVRICPAVPTLPFLQHLNEEGCKETSFFPVSPAMFLGTSPSPSLCDTPGSDFENTACSLLYFSCFPGPPTLHSPEDP